MVSLPNAKYVRTRKSIRNPMFSLGNLGPTVEMGKTSFTFGFVKYP